MKKQTSESKRYEKKLDRRKMLSALGLTGVTLPTTILSQSSGGRVSDRKRTFHFFDSVLEMKQDSSITIGDYVETMGYYEVDDGGHATYQIVKSSGHQTDEGEFIGLKGGLFATLINIKTVNYRMFGAVGNGKIDDGKQIEAAHAYANKKNIPIANFYGEYWIGTTRNIVIQTDVNWGASVFHIDEKHNSKDSIFHVASKHSPVRVELTQSEKKEFLAQFKPGVAILSMLESYKNCLLTISDKKDRIGYRAGKVYGGKVSRMREELFVIEEHGRVIGDIAWEFTDYTSFLAYPLDEVYLTVEGGRFYVSGEGSLGKTYVKNGFQVSRSRTIIRDQWVGLERGKQDTSMAPRSGFYSFLTVYDCLLENIRLIPWEKDRKDKESIVAQGTYGLGGNRMLNVVFRNITAEGSVIHWGVFGTNMNKNFRIERCKLNRVDVHFHCWNLHISDSEIGFKGISITGGGSLIVENTICRHTRFINFRYDYGGKWDGNIYIKDCKLAPSQSADTAILSFLSADFDYRYPIGYARKIKIEDFVVDYRDMPAKESTCWLMLTSSYLPLSGRELFFPTFAEFKNITVKGGAKGLRLMRIPDANGFKLTKEGWYDSTELVSNAQLLFENIQLENLSPSTEEQALHFIFKHTNGTTSPNTLLPQIVFKNCQHFRGDFGGNAASVLFENCTINELYGSRDEQFLGSIAFNNCKFKPIDSVERKTFLLAAVLGTTFTNCLLLAPVIDGKRRPDLLHLIDFVQLNKKVKYNHLNTRLGNDILQYCKKEKIVVKSAFINMLKTHHELEADDVNAI